MIKYKKLITDIIKMVEEDGDRLKSLSAKCTNDTEYWTNYDLSELNKSLVKLVKVKIPKNRKPLGKILLITSYNEPFILSVMPALQALIMGNEVYFKPSSKNYDFVRYFWIKSGLIKKYKLKLSILPISNNGPKLLNSLSSYDSVNFYGSNEVSKKIRLECAKQNVRFVAEVESADFQILFNKKLNKKYFKDLFSQSFSHSGQICQRIQGVYVHKSMYKLFKTNLLNEFRNFIESAEYKKHISDSIDYPKLSKKFILDNKSSMPKDVMSAESGYPKIIFEPKYSSQVVLDAYFLPVIWVVVFEDKNDLIKKISKRPYAQGVNISSDSKPFIYWVINETRYSRYTINSNHTSTSRDTGWGGIWPTGSNGYVNWLDQFSYHYKIID